MTTTALAMIVRDEADNLPACLESVKGLFDELVIVDTGSTDDTVKIARKFGARVFNFDWIDDFSAARNYGLDRVKSDFIFRLDADDRLPHSQRKRLSRLLASLDPRHPTAYFCRVHATDAGGVEATLDEHRLWPNRPSIRFGGRIHERIRLEGDAPDVEVLSSGVRIDHLGYSDADTLTAKLRRNLRILEMELDAPHPSPDTYFDAGRTCAGLGDHARAIDYLDRFLALPASRRTLAGKVAHRTLAEVHRATGDYKAAMLAARDGLRRFPDDAKLVAWVADLLAFHGESGLAREGYEKALSLYDPDRMDAGIPAGFRQLVIDALARLDESHPFDFPLHSPAPAA